MLLRNEDIDSLRQRLLSVLQRGHELFVEAQQLKDHQGDLWPEREPLEVVSDEMRTLVDDLRATIKTLSVDIAGAARQSPLLAESDMHELRHSTRQMLSSVRFKEYRHTGVYIHHDEDVVLGVDPPSQEEHPLDDVARARRLFELAGDKVLDLIDLLSPSDSQQITSIESANYRPNTAFVMMAIDDSVTELEDIRNAVKEVFQDFGIRAIVADEIEHEGAITDRVLHEIDTSEFLFADLSLERPNVYYEVGHAHAQNKRVVLFRKKGTRLHFDLSHRNCPEYKNTSDLKRRLRKRLESITNRPNPRATP